MFSDQDIHRHNYKLRFQEMENKIKKCELERTELEQRFAQLMRERQESEKAAARSLKAKYRRMMEMENQRAERNESLLRMLHKIDQQAASLAAKSDRLKMLKTQYETYLMRSWSSQRALPPAHVPPIYSPQPQLLSPVPQSNPYLFPQRTTESPKSEFVKYLSDMTHVQTVTHSPIPPPMALSNYISSNQPHQPQHFPADYHYASPTWAQKPSHVDDTITSPTSYIQEKITESAIPPTPRRVAPTQSTSKKFELSNEEFIQYIDNEILKGSPSVTELHNIAAPEIIVDSPPPVASTSLPVAYLEDITNDEDPCQNANNLSKDSLIIEEAVENIAKLKLTHTSPAPSPKLESAINQPWEKVVEVVDSVDSDPQPMLTSVEAVEFAKEAPPPLHMEVTEQTLHGVSSEVEEYQLATPEPIHGTPDSSSQLEFVPEQEEVEADPLQSSAVYEETLPEYQQTNAQQDDYQYEQHQQQHYSEMDYQPQHYVDGQENYQEAPTQEYTPQELIGHSYDNTSAVDQQQRPPESDNVSKPSSPYAQTAGGQNYWTTARQAVKSKAYPGMVQSRTPETIQEIVDNGESPQKPSSVSPTAVEQKQQQHAFTPSGSKRSSPTGENVLTSEIHVSGSEPVDQPPIDAIPEQQPTEQQMVDPVQYDYSQYPQEYDPVAEQQQQQDYQYQQDGTDPQYYQYQDQSGQDPSQTQEYQEYADPNQYQQATEYPGPTQYVYDQAYYDQQQQDPNQQAYYDPNATTEPQYYSGEEQQQQQQQHQSDPSYYDQSQAQDTYEHYQLSEPLASAGEESTQPQGESENSTKVDQPPAEDSPPVISSESGFEKQEERKEPNVKSASLVDGDGGEVEEKNDTTIGSANDESDFDFSTQ